MPGGQKTEANARHGQSLFYCLASRLKFHGQDVAMPPAVGQVRSAPQGLDRPEQRALIRTLERGGERRNIAIVTLMLDTGLRIVEEAALDIGDLTLDEHSGSAKVRKGKGGKFRVVLLNGDTRKALRNYLDGRTSGPVFLSQRKDKRLTASGIRQVINQYACLAKLPELHPHALRHTFAKNLLSTGEGLEMVAETLGHESLDKEEIVDIYRVIWHDGDKVDIKLQALAREADIFVFLTRFGRKS